jgi:DNA uptake protein ComE-like DNA-binding protein
LFPYLGGLAICYAGYRARTFSWLAIGLGITVGAIAFAHSSLVALIWLGQIGTALYLRKAFLIKTCPKNQLIPTDPHLARLIAKHYGKVDINKCSKNDLVHHLGLPIVYANQIDRLRQSGLVFASLEQLVSQGGLPASYISRIEPLVIFDRQQLIHQEEAWQCLNSFSVEELITCGVNPTAAAKIVREREQGGLYSSLLEIHTRTGIPIHQFNHLTHF